MSELVTIEKTAIADVFKEGGIDPYIKKIKDEVSSHVPDLKTDKGRKEIASLANKVARSKTYLDGLGKDLVSGIKNQAKVIDSERKKMRDELDLLKAEARKPLTDWEDAEKERVNNLLSRCNEFTMIKDTEYFESHQVESAIKQIESVTVDDSFEDYQEFALKNKDEALTHLKAKLIVMQEDERIAIEKAKEAEERAKKEQEEREAKIAQEAADRAKREAEEAAEKAKKQAEAEVEQARLKAEREAKAKIDEAERKERETREAAERAELERKFKDEQDERQRLQEQADQEAREKDKAHRAEINNKAKADLMTTGLSEKDAKAVVSAIAKGKISNVTIRY